MDEPVNEQLWERAKALAAQHYEVSISEGKLSNGQTIYVAKNPELSGCMAQGPTPSAAEESLREARIDYIYFLLVDSLPVPFPKEQVTQTGVGRDSTTTVAVDVSGHGGQPGQKQSTYTFFQVEPDS